jgi:hypothetical protein
MMWLEAVLVTLVVTGVAMSLIGAIAGDYETQDDMKVALKYFWGIFIPKK